MEIREIKEKKFWEEFLINCKKKTFLQSWNWGNFHVSLGNKIWRFGLYQGDKLEAVALVIKISAKRSSFLLVPHGPVAMVENQKEMIQVLKSHLIDLAKKEKVDFIRISPILEKNEANAVLFKELGFRQGPLHYHPESSWKLNIEKSEEEIFNGMRKTTRYLIKQAKNNNDIEIVKGTNIEDLETFYKIHKEVVKIQKFVPFSLEYLKKEFLSFLENDAISLFLAKYKGQIIAGSFEIFWSDIGFYHHAGLLPKFKKLSVSYLLQWEAIKEAKKRGCWLYDFWGYADPIKNPKHPYAGPTLFKMGFGGHKEEYVKTQDFIISKKYWINYIIETIRRIKRGL